jgi:hypothetical protein
MGGRLQDFVGAAKLLDLILEVAQLAGPTF